MAEKKTEYMNYTNLLHLKLESLRNDQEDRYGDSFRKLLSEELDKVTDFKKTETFLRTKFVDQFCNALRYHTVNQSVCSDNVVIQNRLKRINHMLFQLCKHGFNA